MNVVILGAGASKCYEESATGIKMPIATDFFATYRKLAISENRWVLVTWILNYLKTFHNIHFDAFENYNADIEILHSEIQERLTYALEQEDVHRGEDIVIISAYTQLIFLFTSVINEIQNGPVSTTHINLAGRLKPNDAIITFNWDTLMDRALAEATNWLPEFGYFVKPNLIFRNGWAENKLNDNIQAPFLLKLHGSSNWLTSYMVAENGEMNLIQNTKPEELYVYESNEDPYPCHDGRYMSGYSNYSYGYYPPNLPVEGKPLPEGFLLSRIIMRFEGMPESTSADKGLASMPLIIPPVKNKEYDFFGNLFKKIWEKAEESLSTADNIIVIGYSFPITDTPTDSLFKRAFIKRKTIPNIIIVNPDPERIIQRFNLDYGIPNFNIKVYQEYFSNDFDLEKLFI